MVDRDDRTRELIESLRSSPDAEAVAEARDALVYLYMDVARALAHRYCNRGLDMADLEQVAYMELVSVARTYDPTKGESFLAYAVPCIKGAVRKHFRDRGWTVRPPRRVQELQYDVRVATEQLSQGLGRSPRPSEIAGHLGAPLDHVIEALSATGCFAPTSLDRPLGDDDSQTCLMDLLPANRDDISAAEARTMLAPHVRRLSDRDRLIVRMRFFEQRSQQEIGDAIGVTQMQVSRLLSRILRQLRGWLDDCAEDETPQRTRAS